MSTRTTRNRRDFASATVRGRRQLPRTGLLGIVTLGALFAAAFQSPLGDLAPGLGSVTTFLDDALILLGVLIAIPRLLKVPAIAVAGAFLWVAIMGIAVMRSSLDPAGTLIVARQVLMPVAVIIIGLALLPVEWRRIRLVTIWIGIVNVFYMGLEAIGLHLLDPLSLESFNVGRGETVDGLPAYYRYWLGPDLQSIFGSATFDRLGGTPLNPPVAGLVMAAAFVFLWHDTEFRGRRVWLVLLGVCTLFTFSRGGWLVIIVAVLTPFLLRKFGRIATFVLVIPPLVYIGTQLADHGNSSSHAEGLVAGLGHALTPPWIGQGFGLVGNYVKSLHRADASESLLGIAFSAGGLVALGMAALLVVQLWQIGGRFPYIWEASAGLGIVIAALFSETAGALNGTIPLWLCIGVAISAAARATSDLDAANKHARARRGGHARGEVDSAISSAVASSESADER